jgi:hypothetical protein
MATPTPTVLICRQASLASYALVAEGASAAFRISSVPCGPAFLLESFAGEVIAHLVLHKLHGVINCCALCFKANLHTQESIESC